MQAQPFPSAQIFVLHLHQLESFIAAATVHGLGQPKGELVRHRQNCRANMSTEVMHADGNDEDSDAAEMMHEEQGGVKRKQAKRKTIREGK